MADEIVHLEADGWTCEVAPHLGGAILKLAFEGVDVLRPAPAGASHPFERSSFVMAPYANRIAHGRFAWDGAENQLRPNIDGERHPLHGVGFAAPWRVAERSTHAVRLELRHEANVDWPWDCLLRQRLALDADFHHAATVENIDARDMPAGLGFHPYFFGARAATLTADVNGVWRSDVEQLPVEFSPQQDPWRATPVRGDMLMDNCFAGWKRAAWVQWPTRVVKLTASDNLDHLHVYAPPGADFFCLEPVSHRPNAINARDESGAMKRLRPGAAVSAWMRLAVEEVRA